MRTFKIMIIQSNKIQAFRDHTHTLWNKIYKKFTPKQGVILGRWEHRVDERKTEIKSIWANSDHCGDKICGQPILIKDITNMKKN